MLVNQMAIPTSLHGYGMAVVNNDNTVASNLPVECSWQFSSSEGISQSSSSSSSSSGSSSGSFSAIGTDASRPIPECAAGKTVRLQVNCNLPIHPIIVGVATRRFILYSYVDHRCQTWLSTIHLLSVSVSITVILLPWMTTMKHGQSVYVPLAPLSVFISGFKHSEPDCKLAEEHQNHGNWITTRPSPASTEAVASVFEVQKAVASGVEVQEAVASVFEVRDVNDNGLNFWPECKDACFIGKNEYWVHPSL